MSSIWDEHPELVAALTDLWGKGLSASQIAGQINGQYGTEFSRNAIIGKAARIGLEGRASPIKPAGSGSGPKRETLRRKKRAARMAILGEQPRPIGKGDYSSIMHTIRAFPDMGSPHKTCQWLDGEPRERRFCGEPAVKGQSWCAHHCSIVWLPRDKAA